MTKKVAWLIVSCLMVLTLIISSCGGDEPTENGEDETPGLSPTTPKVGGTLIATGGDFGPIDPTTAQAIRVGHMQMTSSELIQGDWTKGPQGSGETHWDWGFLGDVTLLSGELCESWEFPDSGTIIYNLREGIRYQDRPPANGRELTADDVVWNINMQFDYEGTWQAMSYAPGHPGRPTSVKALDDYTVEVKVSPDYQGIIFLEIGDNLYTNPPECWTEGDGWQDWSEVVGSGPFILADYVVGSSIRYDKHPNYFENDPNNPSYKLPYLDAVKLLIIPDTSSRLAAFRTAQIDMLWGFGTPTWDDAQDLIESNPDLEYYGKLSSGAVAAGRQDKLDLPFHKLEVRQAMNLAVDQKAILEDFYDGKGALIVHPYHPSSGFEKFYTPLEEQPPEVQMLYDYDPEKAKQLLADAGYPEGFKTEIICTAVQADLVSVLKAYLEAVGIDMEIQTVEGGAYNGIWAARDFEQMFFGPLTGVWAPFEQLTTKKGMYSNFSYIDDPYYEMVGEVIGKDMVSNPDKYFKTMKDEGVYELASAWAIWMPGQYNYNIWWPWVQNFYGVSWAGWANISDLYKYFWIDEDMKADMGY
ncbi:MAG: ABC transporter substrate-binding protein [Dehalococcoidales bacterium]|nr:MAG: ABC transporter substrate-binding protein [Dehalococcoidales bacterium]